MSGYGYGFGLRRLLLFLLVIATIFALVDGWGYGKGYTGGGVK
ncbi:hypothetical protein GCM10011571_35070 [Marinithermofilum abyssi]|uniref:Uncharacterized protein n=1 Tax=Marinithermofilum abyssi TaxID=1571185 RepID=A0A8J2VLE8_9BACL|nr:hypothetical protein [Marinithermofilum abyssi]GGE29881.1 hypothetical protein GCM10011571_35070 [Marinithermofilum abyssi]